MLWTMTTAEKSMDIINQVAVTAVSYTHLDVYKRQGLYTVYTLLHYILYLPIVDYTRSLALHFTLWQYNNIMYDNYTFWIQFHTPKIIH